MLTGVGASGASPTGSISRNKDGPLGPLPMRVLHRDPRTGEIKLRVENADDLWHLSNLVQPGDQVRASTYRREESKADKIRPEKAEKVRVTLTLRIEKTEFQAFTDRLRISGVIVDAPQDLGRHHTLNVSVDDDLSILKTWKRHELERIDQAVAAGQKPLVTFLSLDDEDALVAQLRQYGVQELAAIHAPGHGKMFATGDARTAYFEDILSTLTSSPLGEALVLVGPGFTRESFFAFLQSAEPALAAKVQSQGTSQPGMRGIQEALRSGMGSKLFADSRVALETQLVERLLEAIATNRPCAYGRNEVDQAIDAGAVETLLVTESVIRNLQIERMMHEAESARGTVVIVSPHHEAGAKLEGLGGIAALLRFPIK